MLPQAGFAIIHLWRIKPAFILSLSKTCQRLPESEASTQIKRWTGFQVAFMPLSSIDPHKPLFSHRRAFRYNAAFPTTQHKGTQSWHVFPSTP